VEDVEIEQVNPYGFLRLNLQTILYKQGRYSQMHFNFYLACRMSVPGWIFNESDIRTMTGIHRRMVRAHCHFPMIRQRDEKITPYGKKIRGD
jgi:hypothetical protein